MIVCLGASCCAQARHRRWALQRPLRANALTIQACTLCALFPLRTLCALRGLLDLQLCEMAGDKLVDRCDALHREGLLSQQSFNAIGANELHGNTGLTVQ